MTRRAGRSSYAAAVAAAERLGARAGSLERRPEGTTSTVYALSEPPAVLIVAAAGTSREDLDARVALASALSARAPVARPLPGIKQPVDAAGRLVTVWERVPVAPGPVDWKGLGRAVRSLHDVDPAELPGGQRGLRDAHDLTGVRAAVDRLAAAGRLSRGDAATLDAVVSRLEKELSGVCPARVIVHGDLHAPNILPTADGAVLCDFDELALGHPDHDLGFLVDPGRPTIPPATDARRRFEAGYGGPLPSEARARLMARCAHLRRTVRLLERPTGRPRDALYDRLRVASWADTAADWHRDLHPVVAQPRRAQVLRLLRSATLRQSS